MEVPEDISRFWFFFFRIKGRRGGGSSNIDSPLITDWHEIQENVHVSFLWEVDLRYFPNQPYAHLLYPFIWIYHVSYSDYSEVEREVKTFLGKQKLLRMNDLLIIRCVYTERGRGTCPEAQSLFPFLLTSLDFPTCPFSSYIRFTPISPLLIYWFPFSPILFDPYKSYQELKGYKMKGWKFKRNIIRLHEKWGTGWGSKRKGNCFHTRQSCWRREVTPVWLMIVMSFFHKRFHNRLTSNCYY